MLTYTLRRIAISLLVLLGLSILVFFIARLVPGDTVTAMLGLNYTEADAQRLREQYGLDRPLPVQYLLWLSNIVRGDLGTSISGTPVASEIANALPVTLELMVIALLFALLLGIPAGVFAAVGRNSTADYLATFGGLVGLSIPGFWLGAMLILVFALWLGWLPSGTFVPLTVDPVANLKHMILPGIALGLAVAAVVMRMTRTSMLTVLDQDYIRTAHAKGVARPRVFFKHALKNALVPVLTIMGIQAGYLLGGSVVIEEVFSLSGVGRLVLRAIGDRDYPLLQGVILLIGTGFLVINLVVDLLYGLIDPRMRVQSQTG